MKFSEHLAAHLTPEWRTQYVQYEELRDYLTKALEEAPSDERDDGLRRYYFTNCDDVFFSFCTSELTKINNFFEEKLAEARRKFVALRNELLDYEEQVNRRTSVWQSLQMLAGAGGDKAKSKRQNQRKERRKRGDLRLNDLEEGVEKSPRANGSSTRDSNSMITDFTRRISSANLQQMIQRTQARRQELRREKRQVRKLHDIKLGFSEYYLSLIILQNYQSLNFTGFRKILKKHDKLFLRTTGVEWRMANVDNCLFNTNKEVDQMITKVETLYTNQLEAGDRSKAMKRLRVPPLAATVKLWTTFRVGFMFGIFVVQLMIILLGVLYLRPLPTVWEPAMRLFRGTFIVAIFIFLIGINTYGWQTAGVNHVLIFEIDPRNHLSYQEFLEISAMLLIVWASSLIYFLFSPLMGTPAYAGPLVMGVFNVGYLVNPFRCLHYKSRRWLLRILQRIFLAPLYPVTFADFWLADQLNSLVIVFLDCLFFFCFYSCQIDWLGGLEPIANEGRNRTVFASNSSSALLSAGGFYEHLRQSGAGLITVDGHGGFCSSQMYGLVLVVRCLPAWFRLAQCLRRYYDMEVRAPFPHLVNAGKYSTTFFVTVIGLLKVSFFPDSQICLAFWIIILLVATVYTYAWDILMDWGLFDFNDVKCSARSVLRDQLVYRKTASYYFAIVEDLIFRLSWVLDVVLTHWRLVDKEVLRCFLSLGEAVRRFVWNFFRLENEHLNNCGQFRAVRDIFISPVVSNPNLDRPARFELGVSHKSGGSDGGSSSGVGGSSTVACRSGMDDTDQTLPKRRLQHQKMPFPVDTPQRYQPKGNRLFASRMSLDMSRSQPHVELHTTLTSNNSEQGQSVEESPLLIAPCDNRSERIASHDDVNV